MAKLPLAESMRPQTLSEVVSQEHLTGEKGLLYLSVQRNQPLSLIFWGPPGSGKTTLAYAYARSFDCSFIPLSASQGGAAELKKNIDLITAQPLLYRNPIIFIDEIHRYNKAQQDIILPFLEKGVFTLIGATTENPSFSLNDALLSRLRVVKVISLPLEGLEILLKRYEDKNKKLALTEEAKRSLLEMAQGDARHLFNLIENIEVANPLEPLTSESLANLVQRRLPLYDRGGDAHYGLISALHKSLRGSDPDAALYWLCRMLEGGEDPLFIARRLIRMASEDIGLADPEALKITLAAKEAYQILGSPEGELALAQATLYLALAPKSNSVYTAFQQASALARNTSSLVPPSIILNAPTAMMKKMGYGAGYLYDHDQPHGFSGQNYFPEELQRPSFYNPSIRGFEREMRRRIDYFKKMRHIISG